MLISSKKFRLILVFSGIVLLIFILIINLNIKQELVETVQDFFPYMEIQNLHIKGWEKELPRFEIFTKKAIMQNKDNIELLDIYDGKFYDDQKTSVFENINAKKAKLNLRYKEVYLFNIIALLSSPIYAEENLTTIKSEKLKYDDRAKKAYLQGQTTIIQKETTITTSYGIIDNKERTALFKEGFVMDKGEIFVSGQEMWLNLDKEHIKMMKNIHLTKYHEKESKRFEINCQFLEYFSKKQEETLIFRDDVEIKQKGNVLKGGQGVYWEYKNQALISGNPIIYLNSPETLLTGDQKSSFITKNSRLLLKALKIDFEKEIMDFTGPVKLLQPDSTIIGDTGSYYFNKNIISLAGHILIKKNNQYLECDEIKINLNNSIIEASGNIISKMKVQKKK